MFVQNSFFPVTCVSHENIPKAFSWECLAFDSPLGIQVPSQKVSKETLETIDDRLGRTAPAKHLQTTLRVFSAAADAEPWGGAGKPMEP